MYQVTSESIFSYVMQVNDFHVVQSLSMLIPNKVFYLRE